MREEPTPNAVPIDPELGDATSPPERVSGHRPAGRLQPGVLLAVAAGGALGSPARYALEDAFPAPAGAFPAATFAINVSGAFALGLFVIAVIERFPPSRYLRPFVATGFLGAYTTFSTFTVELVTLTKDGYAPMAVVYALASLAVGLVAARIGMTIARRLPLRERRTS